MSVTRNKVVAIAVIFLIFQFFIIMFFFGFGISAIIGIVGCADALKATSLIFGRVPNANKTTATTSTTTSTTVATVDAESTNGDEVSAPEKKKNK